MSLAIMQRFSADHIFRLKQIGLAFFEKIATDQTIAGESQDFYQGLLVGFDRAVKLIDEEDGVRALSLLQAKIAKFIDIETNSYQADTNSTPAISERNSFIRRLSKSYIAKLKSIGAEANLDSDIEEDCICPNETQDFYHGCIAALDFAVSLAGERYAYAQISLLKTNAAYFIDLNKDRERQVHISDKKGLTPLKRNGLYENQVLIDNWVELDNESYPIDKVEQFDTDLLFTQQESLDNQMPKQEDSEGEESNLDALNTSSNLRRQLLNLLESHIDSSDEIENEGVNSKVQVEEQLSSLEEQHRLEMETLLVDILLDNNQKLKQGKLNIIEDWTAFLEDGEAIRVISSESDRIVLRVTLDGEVQSALSYANAEKLSTAIKEKSQESDTSFTTLVSAASNLLEDDFRTDATPSAAMDIQQVEMAESILPIAQKAFDYVLNHFPERVEENDEYTCIRLGDLYDLMVTESQNILVSSLTASGRGELIRVRGEELVLARGILSEDVEFWSMVAQRLDAITEKSDILPEDYAEFDKPNDIEI
ncbi:hypothetical protein [Argonema antarcticum]|uniref:hypothetical protein n=1 Tax=Argonema antarcticum TaxID=2942763 RepID=UPI0020125B8F|nr:hypothetical protein [Argonema antarcticum]MCL1472023.1 hypothetical protein [Argonema antarcticum A004/B2]